MHLSPKKKKAGIMKIFSTCFLIDYHICYEMYKVYYLFFKLDPPDDLLFNMTIAMIY